MAQPGTQISDVVTLTQAMLGDKKGSWATYTYLKPYLQLANNKLSTMFESLNMTYGERQVVLSNVAANTKDLSAFVADGQPLEDLQDPLSVEWRLVGADDAEWQNVPRVDKVIDVPGNETAGIGTSEQGVDSYAWRNSTIYLTPSGVPVDLRVCYDALTVNIADPTDSIIRGAINIFAYRTAQHVAAFRGGLAGTGEPLAKYLERMFGDENEDFVSLMTKRSQSVLRRFGRANRYRGAGPWTIPVV